MRIILVLAFAVPIGLVASALAQSQTLTLTLGGRAAVTNSKPAAPFQTITYLYRNGGPGDRTGLGGSAQRGTGGGSVGGLPPGVTTDTSVYYTVPYWYPVPVAPPTPYALVPFEICVKREGEKSCKWHNTGD